MNNSETSDISINFYFQYFFQISFFKAKLILIGTYLSVILHPQFLLLDKEEKVPTKKLTFNRILLESIYYIGDSLQTKLAHFLYLIRTNFR